MSTHIDYFSLACRLADIAASHSMRSFRTALDIDMKSDASPVTMADRAAEAAMRSLLGAEAPSHGILGEEYGSERLDAEYVWVLDPIDGTKSYITGSPLWGTLIALTHRGRPVLGLIDMPVLGERWVGGAGETANRNGEAVRVRNCTQLAQARILTTSPDSFSPSEWQAYDALSRRCAMRRFGGDCYGYAQLAGGHVDLVAECGLQPYDYMALVGVVEAAGGVISDWEGRPLSIRSDGRVLAAASAPLHDEALRMLRGVPGPQPA